MEYIISYSFINLAFKDELISEFLGKFSFKKIERQLNFQWETIESSALLPTLKFDQLRFKLRTGGDKILIQNLNNSLPRILGDRLNDKTTSIISEFIEDKFTSSVAYGFIHEYIDYSLNNSDETESWKIFDRELIIDSVIVTNERFKKDEPGMDIVRPSFISIESLPGHYHQMSYGDLLWFGSCWQMYFSSKYYKYIPKNLFDSFKNCYSNNVYEDGLRKIVLYKDGSDFNLPENRSRQWSFRRELGIDSIAHELVKSENRIEPLNVPVLITKENCQVGKTRVTRFLGGNNELVMRNLAVKLEIKEYMEDGMTLVLDEFTEKCSSA